MAFEIRAVEPEDAGELHGLLISDHTVDGTMRLPYATLAETQVRVAPSAGVFKLVALEGGQIVGYGELITNPHVPRHAHVGEINILITRSDRQRKGVGRALMEAMINLADDWCGLVRLELTAWRTNDHAIRLYESLGFEREGVRPAYVRWKGDFVDAIMMGRIRMPE